MTDQQPVSATVPPADLLRGLVEGAHPSLAAAHVTRMHFPTGRPTQIHFRDAGGAWIAEWIGADVTARAGTEAERLEKLGQSAQLHADAALGLLARPMGLDAKLPALRLASDAGFADSVLCGLGLRGPFRVDLVAHRLGKRAVLRICHARGTAFARLRAPGATQARLSAERHGTLWTALRSDPRVRLPEPIAHDPALGLSLYRALPGVAPRFHRLRGFAEVEAISHALIALQQTELDAPPHTAADELSVLRAWLHRLELLDPALAGCISPLLDRLERDLHDLPAVRPVLCHRDLHEGQILIHRGTAGLMDFDTLRHGDPALDIGNLQAHLVLAGFRQNRSFGAYITALERLFPTVSLDRVAVWRRAALLRLAMILAFTTESPSIPAALVAAAE